MTGVPAPKPKAYRPWREIAAELASGKDLAKVLELAHELNCALEAQSFGLEKQNSSTAEGTTEKLSSADFDPKLNLAA